MDGFYPLSDHNDPIGYKGKQRPTTLQIEFSLALGISAFLTFCVSPRSGCQGGVVADDMADIVSETEMERIVCCKKEDQG